jgi:predicted phosphoribosyltransferase
LLTQRRGGAAAIAEVNLAMSFTAPLARNVVPVALAMADSIVADADILFDISVG